jgi:WD40 repeat protein
VRSPEGQIVEVTSVAFSGDGQTLISGGGAGLRIWQVKR